MPKIAFFDLETTGVDVVTDRIVQIAATKTSVSGKILEEINYLVNPGRPIPEEATEVHGITNEMIRDKPSFKQLSEELLKFFDGCYLAGHNVCRFDIPFLHESFARVGIKFKFNPLVIDTFRMYSELTPRDLGSIYKKYTGEELEGAHDAMADTRGSLTIFNSMLDESFFESKSLEDIGALSYNKETVCDLAGKFVKNKDGVVVFNFGKNIGKPAVNDPGFLQWMLDKNFSSNTKSWVRKILKGRV